MFNTIRLIGTITRSIQVQSNKKFSPLGLGNNAFLYIIRAIENPGMFLGELADALSIDRSTAFRSIKKLAKNGYLDLKSDDHDGRLQRVFPTQIAKDIYPELFEFEKSQSKHLLEKLSKDEQAELLRLLEKTQH